MSVYTSVANPVWYDVGHTMITVDVVFPHLGTASVKFVASPNDGMDYGRQIYSDLVAGKYGVIAASPQG